MRRSGIQGITKKVLYDSWKEIRSELRRNTYRDVLDHLEYDIDPDVWIDRLLREIANGTYAPHPPDFRPLAKSKGFSRRIAYPHIPDLVLYRACVDALYAKARRARREHSHVYFERSTLASAQDEAEQSAKAPIDADDFARAVHEHLLDYASGSTKRFRAWLRYSQYRRQLIFGRVHPYIVCTDVTNYFDSVRHSHVAEALHEVRAPSRMVTLLFRLLEELCYRGGMRPSPESGLPVDECDCSRKLAHMVLFEHDDKMVSQVGEKAYLRWMDDQTFGVSSRAGAFLALAKCDASLASLHLAPNSGKTRIMTTAEARVHFHLVANDDLDEISKMEPKTSAALARMRKQLLRVWKKAISDEGKGNWDKILKRVLLEASRCRARHFRKSVNNWLIQYPSLTGRLCDYMRATGSTVEYIRWVEKVFSNPEQIYPDVNLIVAESLLRLEPRPTELGRIRLLISMLLSPRETFPGDHSLRAIAPLLQLRYGDGRSVRSLKRIFDKEWHLSSRETIRAASATYASYGAVQLNEVKASASKRLRNHLSGIVVLLDRIQHFESIPNSYKSRFNFRNDPIRRAWYFDTRSMLAAKLLRLSTSSKVQKELDDLRTNWLTKDLPVFDKQWLRKHL